MRKNENMSAGDTLKKLVDLPEEVLPSGKYLLLPINKSDEWRKIFTKERLKIISTLKNANPVSESKLAEILGRKRENVMYDIKILKHLGVVRTEKEDNRVIVRVNKDMVIIPF